MNKLSGSHYRNPAEFRRNHYARRDRFQRETVLPLGAALIIILLSSLALWCAIWWVISALPE